MSSPLPSGLLDWKLLSTLQTEHNIDDQVLGEYQADANLIKLNSRDLAFRKSLAYAGQLPRIEPRDQFFGTYNARNLNIKRLTPW
jgi:hypothetical protein